MARTLPSDEAAEGGHVTLPHDVVYILLTEQCWTYFELKRLRGVASYWRDTIDTCRKLDAVMFRVRAEGVLPRHPPDDAVVHPLLAKLPSRTTLQPRGYGYERYHARSRMVGIIRASSFRHEFATFPPCTYFKTSRRTQTPALQNFTGLRVSDVLERIASNWGQNQSSYWPRAVQVEDCTGLRIVY